MRIPLIHDMTVRLLAVALALVLTVSIPIMVLGEESGGTAKLAESFIAAAELGDLAAVKKLLSEGADVNGTNRLMQRALPSAAANGNIEVVRLLLEKGAYIEATDQDCLTPLMNACERGHLEIVRLLLDKGADINAQTKAGATPLRKAVNEQNVEVVRLLLDRGANVTDRLKDGTFILMSAALTGNSEILKSILDKGADINARGNWGSSALTWAAVMDRSDVVKLLRSRGAESDLCTAALIGDVQEVERLIQKGANVNALDGMGFTSLMNASRKGHTEVVDLLLDNGADPEAKRMCGFREWCTVFDYALLGGRPEIVATLMNKNAGNHAGPDAPKWEAYLPKAIKLGRLEGVKLLLSSGVDVNARIGSDEASLLMIACNEGRIEIAKLLLDNGADVNQRNVHGDTALMWAASHGAVESVKLLLANGADANAHTRGYTALNSACNGPIRDLLKAHGGPR